jgi:pyridoxamine 5'-phosphate oxidase
MSDCPQPLDATQLSALNPIEGDDPFALFKTWLASAHKAEISDANAMALATCDAQKMPNVRIVLIKSFDQEGFSFYTNLKSVKAVELICNPQASGCFHWKSLARQVRVRGRVVPISDTQADDYFSTRPQISKIGAWASRQSSFLANREELERAVDGIKARFENQKIPRPPYWSGFLLVPSEIEFWCSGEFRLHERVRFEKVEDGWTRQHLYP